MSSSDSGGETMEGQEAPEGPEGLEHFEHGYEQQQQEHNADDVGDLFGGSEDEAESHAQARDDDDWMNAGPAGGRLRRGASHGDFGGRNPRAGLEHFGAALDRQQQNQSRGEAVGAPGPSRGPRRIDDDEESEANDELPIGGASHDPDGSESMGSGAQADLTFDGFDDRMFKVEGEPVPLLRSRATWARSRCGPSARCASASSRPSSGATPSSSSSGSCPRGTSRARRQRRRS